MHPTSLLSYQKVKEQIPLSQRGYAFIAKTKESCRQILRGKDHRKAIVAGPCSIHNIDETVVYARLLKKLAKQVENTCLIIMRVYVEKARTSLGWKGLIYDPSLVGENNLMEGILQARNLLVCLAEEGIACATEFVDPLIAPYIEDLISWGFIGARTSASQPHRQLASLLDMPVGFKNSIDGNIGTAIHAVQSASRSHTFLFPNAHAMLNAVCSQGNPWTHIVLRGSSEMPNYTLPYLNKAKESLLQASLPPRIMVDCSHGNAAGNFYNQQEVFRYLLNVMDHPDFPLFGIMLESYLKSGKQELDASSILYGISVTDPCLDWGMTEELILEADASLSSEMVMRST